MRSILRPTLSTFLVAVFFFILLFLGLFAEVFESHTPEVDLAQIYANPMPVGELQHLKTLKLTNKHGSFLLMNTEPMGNLSGPWQLLEPQSLKVKDDVVVRIVDALNVVRVRNFHRHEPINVTSFSLDNPTLSLNFNTSNGKTFEIKMGLINPIDNSAYLTLNTQNQIYQIDPIEMALESYDLAQLVESKVLALGKESLASLEIYNNGTQTLKLLKKEEQWLDQNGVNLSATKVTKLFDRLEDIKSHSILDNLSPEQKEFMGNVMATPTIILKLISGQGLRSYLLAPVTESIPGMAIEKNHFYALSSEEKTSFVLIDKDQLKVFTTKPSELK